MSAEVDRLHEDSTRTGIIVGSNGRIKQPVIGMQQLGDQMGGRPNYTPQNIPILSFPRHIFSTVLQKMKSIALCRMRRTAKAIDSYLEKHRFRIESHTSHVARFVPIGVNEKGRSLLCVFRDEKRALLNNPVHALTLSAAHLTRIVDPFAQLSGMLLNSIFIMIPFWMDRRAQRKICKEQWLPILKSNRFKCKNLVIFGATEKEIPTLLSLISFERLSLYHSKFPLQRLDSWKIKNCVELYIYLDEIPEDFGTLFTRHYLVKIKTYNTFAFSFAIRNFIQRIGENLDERGALRILQCSFFFPFDVDFFENFEGAESIYPRQKSNNEKMMQFFKVKCGVILIDNTEKIFTAVLTKTSDRDCLYQILTKVTHRHSVAISYEKFISAPSDTVALEQAFEPAPE